MSWHKWRERIKLSLIVVWLLFTVAFALWWFDFSLTHIHLLARLQPEQMALWTRQERMIKWEGSAWLLLLILGGLALIALESRERARAQRIRQFFASFSHDVKTSLASLRLQTEALKDELGSTAPPRAGAAPGAAASAPAVRILDRLVADTVRLQLQLENSLFLSSQNDLKLYSEWIRLSDLVERMREQWPGVALSLKRDAALQGDDRALRTILSNLVKNAILHGKATEIVIDPEPAPGKGRLLLRFQDNGSGFEGEVGELGQLFSRPRSSSGSGLGLYICRLLVEKMRGQIRFHADNHGFRVEIEMGGELR